MYLPQGSYVTFSFHPFIAKPHPIIFRLSIRLGGGGRRLSPYICNLPMLSRKTLPLKRLSVVCHCSCRCRVTNKISEVLPAPLHNLEVSFLLLPGGHCWKNLASNKGDIPHAVTWLFPHIPRFRTPLSPKVDASSLSRPPTPFLVHPFLVAVRYTEEGGATITFEAN